MESPYLAFRDDSPLFQTGNVADTFARLSEEEIDKELARYREHVLKRIETIVSDLGAKDSSLRVFSSDERTPVETLKQCAL